MEAVKEKEIEEEKEVYLIEEQEEDFEEVIEEVDEGEMLVLRRALSGLKTKQEQRENIFHSRCIVQGKACSLLIDGESCANVVSLSMMEKLNLRASTYPHS